MLNLGKDSNNLCLHFNPRFDAYGDANTIVCNSKDGGAWGTEQREPAFPFQPGSIVEVGRAGAELGPWVGWAVLALVFRGRLALPDYMITSVIPFGTCTGTHLYRSCHPGSEMLLGVIPCSSLPTRCASPLNRLT